MADNNKIEIEEVEETEAVETVKETKTEKPAKAAKKTVKEDGFFKRAFERIKKFWKSYKSELKKITWFSRKQTFTSTLLVLVCMIIAATFIGVLDFGFSKGLEGLGSLVEFFRR